MLESDRRTSEANADGRTDSETATRKKRSTSKTAPQEQVETPRDGSHCRQGGEGEETEWEGTKEGSVWVVLAGDDRTLLVDDDRLLPSIHLVPLAGHELGVLAVVFEVISHARVERIIRFWCREKRLDGEQDGANLQSGAPLVLQNVQANAPERVNVGVVDFRQKPDLGRLHRIRFREEELEFILTAFVGRAERSSHKNFEVTVVVRLRLCRDARRGLAGKVLRFLLNALGDRHFPSGRFRVFGGDCREAVSRSLLPQLQKALISRTQIREGWKP